MPFSVNNGSFYHGLCGVCGGVNDLRRARQATGVVRLFLKVEERLLHVEAAGRILGCWDGDGGGRRLED